MQPIVITKKEAEVLLHRLTLHDTIGEACTDYDPEHDPTPLFSREEIEAAAARLEHEVSERGTLTIASDAEREVIEDVVDGNTFGPSLDDGVDNGQLTARQAAEWRRVIRRLNDKLQTGAGVVARFPL